MNDTLRRCLEDLEQRISPDEEGRLFGEWVQFSEGGFQGDIFSPRRRLAPPAFDWPSVSINAALGDFDAMALRQFGECSRHLTRGDGLILNVRCDYGSSILPSLFGAEPFIMDEEANTLPTSLPLSGPGAIRKLLNEGVPDLRRGYGSQVLEMGERYIAMAGEYPNVARWIHVYHPDFQGPIDVVEVLWGSSVFYALYDSPELVEELLELIVPTYAAFMRAWQEIVPFEDGYAVHWGLLHKGHIMLRDDSAMNLSPEMFDRFVRPYDQRLLDEFGGGAIHFCGRGDHFIESMSENAGLHAVQMSQPHLNDLEVIYRHTVDKGIKLLDLSRSAAEAALAHGRPLHGCVHCA